MVWCILEYAILIINGKKLVIENGVQPK